MTTEVDVLAGEIASRYGSVRRARGPFLYTAKGERLTDLFQENGRAILGWGGGSAFTVLKNVLARGLTGSYTTDFSPRLERAVSDLLGGGRRVYAFAARQQALAAALRVAPEGVAVFKPWLPDAPDWAAVPAVVLEPPLPWTAGIYLLAVADTIENELKLVRVQQSFVTVRLPAVLCAAAARSLYDLIKALQERQEKDWFLYDVPLTRYWERRGPYLYPRSESVPQERYEAFILHCLDCGVVISPSYMVPSIVPFGADPGVFSKLVKRPFPAADK